MLLSRKSGIVLKFIRYTIVLILILNFSTKIIVSIQNDNYSGAIAGAIFLFLIVIFFIPLEIYVNKYNKNQE